MVAGAEWSSGAGSVGFGCAGREQGGRTDVPETPTDPGRGKPFWWGGPFPGATQISDEVSREAKLGVSTNRT